MKSIILFRHAKTESCFLGRDHDRPLTEAGILDAGKMGHYLAEKNELPDLLLSSTAVRAKTTVDIAMNKGKWPCPLELDAGIYGGDQHFLLDLINNQDNTLSSICLVGHEPNFSNFIACSTGNAYKPLVKGSMAKIDFDVKCWENIAMGFGNQIWWVEPGEV